MLDNFKGDLKHYFSYVSDTNNRSRYIGQAILEASLWVIAVFRFGKWAQRLRFAPLRKPFIIAYVLMYKVCEIVTGIRISADSEIAPGLLIHNFGGVIVHGRIGRNCFINQGAQMISRGDGKARGWPTLGDNVYVGAGAKIVGNVKVGNNVRIGANAVVMKDVPDDSVVMPPASKVIKGIYRVRLSTKTDGEREVTART